ncbi:pyridoxal 5'-phosphate synthase [Kitasatospora sp. DSM 101779]|uniref:pyridoxine/pyridoxamine 5'-phosphate oxidase n=1 Tax=Kitasatospora sp. DSM 101779 TaxID=2853165 RepID=UPI0021DAFB6D|nr:pyridoxamine 5'-phosphate oxidase family protein [Kitasatospora sp. DSM 101779]
MVAGDDGFDRYRPSPVGEMLRDRPPMARELPLFDPDLAPAEPGPLFVDWLVQALEAGVLDPQVMTLSTVDADGVPDARALVLRDVDAAEGAWLFAAEADSPKGRQLALSPMAALSVYWPLVGRQVRVRGSVEAAPPAVSAEEFRGRSPGARVASLVGRQSEPLGSLAAYDLAADEAQLLLDTDPELVAAGHTVYILRAAEVEFWQGDPSRRHVRLRYTRTGLGTGRVAWTSTLLWP